MPISSQLDRTIYKGLIIWDKDQRKKNDIRAGDKACNPQWADSAILPARLANHSAGLVYLASHGARHEIKVVNE